MLLNNYSRLDLHFEKGNGCVLFDEKRKDYIDFGSGIGVCSLGHGNKKLAKIIYKQSKNLIHTSNLYKIRPQEELSKLMSNLLNKTLKEKYYFFFSNSGAEANECAIKLARKYAHERKIENPEIISLENSFHGRTLGTLKLTGQDKFHVKDFEPYPEGFVFYKNINEIISKLNKNTAGVFLELVQGEGGINPLNKQEVQKLAQVLKEKNILLITDEIQCGTYRTGEFVTSKIYGIKPDIITFAKGLAGGIPIGATACNKNIFNPGDHGSTFGGNFLATNTAKFVLQELNKLKNSSYLDKTIKTFTAELDKIAKDFKNLIDKRTGLGLMQGLVLKNSENLDKIYKEALKQRVLILKSGKSTLRFLPSLNINDKEMKKGFKRLRKALSEFK